MKLLILVLAIFAPLAMAATPWETYLDLPTPNNASKVMAIEYTVPKQGNYDAIDLGILQDQIMAEDTEAFALAYRLYESADGGLAEDLGVILAKTIRAHPVFFLQQVMAHGGDCKAFHWVLNTPGLEYSDREEAMRYEIRARSDALRKIRIKSLANIRDQCLKQIDTP